MEGFMKAFFLLILGLSVSELICSSNFKNELSGRVLDQATGWPIAETKIELRGQGAKTLFSAISDSRSFYWIQNIPPGKYNLVITHPEYMEKEIKNVEIKPNHTTYLYPVHLALATKHRIFEKIEGLSFGNSQINGRVFDLKSTEPIAGSRIRVLLPNGTSTRMGTVTDNKGNFQILNVIPGRYQVEISYGPTHTKELIKDILIYSGRRYTLKPVFLSVRIIEKDTVLVRGPLLK